MLIVAIEGADGSGKTTQAKILVNRLKKEGYKVIYVQPVFMLLNTLTRSKSSSISIISPRKIHTYQEPISDKHSWLFLSRKQFMGLFGYLYALITHLFIKFYLSKSKIVICDRYFYQFFFDLFGESSRKAVSIFPKPDITFFLDGDANILYPRMSNSFDKTVNKAYYIDVISFYRKLSQKYGFIQIDASLDRKMINDIAFEYLVKELKGNSYG